VFLAGKLLAAEQETTSQARQIKTLQGCTLHCVADTLNCLPYISLCGVDSINQSVLLVERLYWIEDRGQTDHVITSIHTGLTAASPRCTPCHTADDVTIKTYHYDRQSVLIGCHIRYLCNTYTCFALTLILAHDLDFQSQARYGHDPYTCIKWRSKINRFKRSNGKKQTRPIALPFPLMQSVIMTLHSSEAEQFCGCWTTFVEHAANLSMVVWQSWTV